MKSYALGNTEIQITELSFGTLILGRLQADLSPEQSAPALARAVELGVNFFDTAQAYGTEEHLRLGLGPHIHDVVIATKTHARTREDARKAFEQSLRELGRDHIDIYELHLIESAHDLARRLPVTELLLELKQQGRIRAIGASVHRVEAARAVAQEPHIDVLFPVINAQGLGIIDGSAQEMLQAVAAARENGKGVYAMKPLGGGHLRRTPEASFAFLRQTGLFHSICAGMKSPAEVEMNVCLFEGRPVPADTKERIETTPRSLKIYDRCIGCGACVDACDQGALSMDHSKADPSRDKKGQSVVDPGRCILCGYCAEVCPTFSIRVV